jgi:hypothetical protein
MQQQAGAERREVQRDAMRDTGTSGR